MFDVNKLSTREKMKTLSKILAYDGNCGFGNDEAEDIVYVSEEGYYSTLQLLGALVVDFSKMKKDFKYK